MSAPLLLSIRYLLVRLGSVHVFDYVYPFDEIFLSHHDISFEITASQLFGFMAFMAHP